jgi:hypothetical protein
MDKKQGGYMHSRVPLPTDNIFKFYALFGLLISIFCISSIIYVNKITNELVFKTVLEQETLNAIIQPNATQQAKKRVLHRRLEIALSDKWFFQVAIGLMLFSGSYLTYYGFKRWHNEIQPLQDEITRLSIQKLKKELKQSLPKKVKQT